MERRESSLINVVTASLLASRSSTEGGCRGAPLALSAIEGAWERNAQPAEKL